VAYVEQDEINRISKNLKCLVCENQSVAESQSDFANYMREEVAQYLDKGYSDREIYAAFSTRYGEEILLNPLPQKKTFALWLVPLSFGIIFLMAYGCLFFRKRF